VLRRPIETTRVTGHLAYQDFTCTITALIGTYSKGVSSLRTSLVDVALAIVLGLEPEFPTNQQVIGVEKYYVRPIMYEIEIQIGNSGHTYLG
jgi:hypothetical protein